MSKNAENETNIWLQLRRDWVVLAILSLPSIYLLLTVSPLWRDSDGFNEVASTFAPKGIIHWLPGYCLCGRLVVIIAASAADLVQGKGLPPLSISITPLNDFGVYTLIVLQHLLLVFSLYCFVRTVTDRFWVRFLCAAFFALTPWMYVYANCVGSEAFSNPLVILAAASGWNCLRAPKLGKKNLFGDRTLLAYLAVLVMASLTRQVNILLGAALPLALLPRAILGVLRSRSPHAEAAEERGLEREGESFPSPAARLDESPGFAGRRLLIFAGAAVVALGISIFVQSALCWICRVPFRSTLGETFEWRLAYLRDLAGPDRALTIQKIDRKINDPIVTDALEGLSQSLSQGDPWKDMFLFYRIDDLLLRSGLKDMQIRTWQIDLRLNRIATTVLCSMEPHYLSAVWSDFMRAPLFSQSDLAYSPFILTDWLHTQLANPRYGRLRGLASFRTEAGYGALSWQRTPYFHFLAGVPMVWMACVAVASSLAGLVLSRENPIAELRATYSLAMVVLGFLMALGSCLTTFSAARFYLPVYSLFQIGMILGGLAASPQKSRAGRDGAFIAD
jgi:hypothetical protein